MNKRHKWVSDKDGKSCIYCNSRVNTKSGFVNFIERDDFGVLKAVNWYPRCKPFIEIILDKQQTI